METRKQEPSIPLSAITDRISEIDSSIERLEMERDMLMGLRNRVLHDALPSAPPSNGKPKKGASDAIREVLAEHPGSRPYEIINRLDGVVDSKAKDFRKTMYSIIASLRKRGHIRKTHAGRLYLVTK